MRKRHDSTPDTDLQSPSQILARAEIALMECQELFGAIFDAADNAARVSVIARAGAEIAGAAYDEIGHAESLRAQESEA